MRLANTSAMKRHTFTALLIFVAVLLTSPSEVEAQQSNIEELEHRVAQLEQMVSQLQQRIAELETKVQGRQDSGLPVVAKGNWREKSNWRRLRKGMTMEQVVELLGEPEKVDAGSIITFWYWGYPSGGRVQFDSANRLNGWSEPSR